MSSKPPHTGPLSPEYALLGLLLQGPTHGYELYQKLIADLGQVWHVSLSQSYSILNRLEAGGFIAAEIVAQDKLPDRKLLNLTPAGQERFERWLNTTSRTSVRAIRLEFLTRLYFARSIGPDFSHQLIDNQLAEVRSGLERLRHLIHDLPKSQLFNWLSIELRSRQLESIEVWLENCHRAIDDKSFEASIGS